MSYQTDIWICNLAENDLDIFEIEDAFLNFGKTQNLSLVSEAVFDAFSAINDQSGPFVMHNTYGETIIRMCAEIAKLMPQASFCIGGIGEEFDDMWLAQFSDGKENKFMTFEGALNR